MHSACLAMRYLITQAQWDVINDDCKVVNAAGERFFRERHALTHEFTLTPVIIVDALPHVDVPTHYAHCWPVDPRD